MTRKIDSKPEAESLVRSFLGSGDGSGLPILGGRVPLYPGECPILTIFTSGVAGWGQKFFGGVAIPGWLPSPVDLLFLSARAFSEERLLIWLLFVSAIILI